MIFWPSKLEVNLAPGGRMPKSDVLTYHAQPHWIKKNIFLPCQLLRQFSEGMQHHLKKLGFILIFQSILISVFSFFQICRFVCDSFFLDLERKIILNDLTYSLTIKFNCHCMYHEITQYRNHNSRCLQYLKHLIIS